MLLDPRERRLVLGKTGTGKSNYVKDMCAVLVDRGQRVVVFDVCDEYSVEGHPSKEVRLGPLHQRADMEELTHDPRRYLDRRDLQLAIVTDGKPLDVAEDFETAAELVKHTGRLVFVIEETGYFQEHCQETLKEVATLWRKREISVVFVAQRAVQVPLTARSQASEIVSFLQDEQADLDALHARCGRSDPEFADRVSRLPAGKFEVWRATTQQENKKP